MFNFEKMKKRLYENEVEHFVYVVTNDGEERRCKRAPNAIKLSAALKRARVKE